MTLKRHLLKLYIQLRRWQMERAERSKARFEQRLKSGLIVGKPHHTTKPLSQTYMESLK